MKSIEEKAKSYDEAIKRAKGVIEQNPLMEYLKKRIEYILPELKESEDERIRKALIDRIECFNEKHMLFNNGVSKNKVIAWLEKQNKNDFNLPLRETIFNVWALGNEWKDITGGFCSTEHGTQIEYIIKHWKEGEYYRRINNK